MVRVLVLSLVMLLAAPLPASAAKKALVIGIDTYDELVDLEKARADARAYRAALSALGYAVTMEVDLSTPRMQIVIGAFIDSISPGDEVAFVYAGHGWSDGATNYLIGSDTPKKTSESALRRVAIPLRNGTNGVIDDIQRRGARMVLAVVDACRSNPFESRLGRSGTLGLSRGLALVPAVTGTFIVFSAGAGQEALDRLTDDDPHPNSVFSRVFLAELREGGTLQDIVLDTAPRVARLAEQVGHTQRPAYYDGIGQRYCLTERCERIIESTIPDVPPEPAKDETPWLPFSQEDSQEEEGAPKAADASQPVPREGGTQTAAVLDPYFTPEPVVVPVPRPATPPELAAPQGEPVQFIVRGASPIRAVADLHRESICTVENTPEQPTIKRFFRSRGLVHFNRQFLNLRRAVAALERSKCSGIAVPPRLVDTVISMVRDPSRYVILPEIVR